MEEQSANPPGRQDESRRYRILEVVGEGGFGKVYRARLEGAEGFAKDVAIKLLSDDEAPEIVLQRFRDESRILGLVRDRAIVTVDPPTRLDGRWAVVMEFVDGVNCQVLMKRTPLPPRTAMEIVQEVARALDNVYNQEGPDGTPLHLVHRDIKPGNIQVTPSGTVKILDFGIARAEFQARESKTTTHIGGTFGYIAPERLHGEEGPASDVYSLGIVLGALVTGRRCTTKNRTKIEEWVAQDEDLAKVWALSKRMAHVDPEERPSAREVEDECAALGPTLRGEPLRRWAEQNVQAKPDFIEDHLIGNVLTETMAHV
ncbi:MAG: serine/threonine protein kinase, partial [Myxococcales bacterium]|nr:serine/threonine protein kinase [Myxococcales bacterium]